MKRNPLCVTLIPDRVVISLKLNTGGIPSSAIDSIDYKTPSSTITYSRLRTKNTIATMSPAAAARITIA